MATLYTQADHNKHLTWIYLSGFLIFVMGVGYVFSRAMQNSFILYLAVIFSVMTSFISYWWSDKIVLSINGAQKVTRENARDIYNIVENLCITAGLPVPRIYIINDPSPNAFATGRDPQHGVVCLTTGLINKLEKSELEGVIAHELSHIGNRDILLSTVITVLVGFVILLADWFKNWVFWGRGNDDNDNNQFRVLMMILALILSLLAPLAAVLMQLAISRKREYLADASGALLTRYPEGLANALEKIDSDPQPLQRANRSTAHLFIANPFKGKKISRLFMTHPPIQERIKKLREMSF